MEVPVLYHLQHVCCVLDIAGELGDDGLELVLHQFGTFFCRAVDPGNDGSALRMVKGLVSFRQRVKLVSPTLVDVCQSPAESGFVDVAVRWRSLTIVLDALAIRAIGSVAILFYLFILFIYLFIFFIFFVMQVVTQLSFSFRYVSV